MALPSSLALRSRGPLAPGGAVMTVVGGFRVRQDESYISRVHCPWCLYQIVGFLYPAYSTAPRYLTKVSRQRRYRRGSTTSDDYTGPQRIG